MRAHFRRHAVLLGRSGVNSSRGGEVHADQQRRQSHVRTSPGRQADLLGRRRGREAISSRRVVRFYRERRRPHVRTHCGRQACLLGQRQVWTADRNTCRRGLPLHQQWWVAFVRPARRWHSVLLGRMGRGRGAHRDVLPDQLRAELLLRRGERSSGVLGPSTYVRGDFRGHRSLLGRQRCGPVYAAPKPGRSRGWDGRDASDRGPDSYADDTASAAPGSGDMPPRRRGV